MMGDLPSSAEAPDVTLEGLILSKNQDYKRFLWARARIAIRTLAHAVAISRNCTQ